MNRDKDLIEEALPGYEVGTELGRGAWGVVYDGRHRTLERQVAIKQLPRAFAADPNVRQRFALEARTAASLEHPHIVKVYDFVDRDDGVCLIVMERMHGTLADRFYSAGLETDETLAAGLATCAGLAFAHARNILHRDIKPENLLYSSSGVLKVGDFGIARALDTATRLTATGLVIGTPAYMSPEQASGETLTPASDVYSLGIMLYELLSGSLPYDEADSIGALIRQHLTEPPIPILDRNPELPRTVAEAIDRSIRKDPGDRYADAEPFGIALAEASVRAFGAGWLRQRRFHLMAAPEIAAATERDLGGSGRAGTMVIRGERQERVVPDEPVGGETMAPTATPGPAGSPSRSVPSPLPTPPGVPAPSAPPPGGVPVPDRPSGPPTGGPPTSTPSEAVPVPERRSSPPESVPQQPATPPPFPGTAASTPPGGVAPPTGPLRSGSVPPPPNQQTGPTPEASDGGPKRRVPVAVIVLLVLAGVLGAGAAAVFALGGDDDGSASDDVSSDDPDDGGSAPDDGTSSGDDGGAGDADDPASGGPGTAGGRLTIAALLSDEDRDADDLVAIQLALDDIADAGGVLGGDVTLLDPIYTPVNVPSAIEAGATVVIGPGDPLQGRDLGDYVDGRALFISHADWFDRRYGIRERYARTEPGLAVPVSALVDKLPESGRVTIAIGTGTGRGDDPGEPYVTVLGTLGYDVTLVAQEQGEEETDWATRIAAAGTPDVLVVANFLGRADFYETLFASGITPQSVRWIELGLSPGTSGLEDGQLAGLIGLGVDVLTGSALEDRVAAADFSADAAQAYDAVVLAALAAEAAGSTDVDAMASRLREVTAGGTVCRDVAACLQLLREGSDIDYDGPSGPIELGPDGKPGLILVRHQVIGAESNVRYDVNEVTPWPSDALVQEQR